MRNLQGRVIFVAFFGRFKVCAIDWTAIAAIGGPAAAIVAVYLAYRLQVRTIRVDRLRQDAAELLATLDAAVVAVESLTKLLAVKRASLAAGTPMPVEHVRNLNLASRTTRVEVGLDFGVSPESDGVGAETAPKRAVEYADETGSLVDQVLNRLGAMFERSASSMELLGLPETTVGKVRSVEKKLGAWLAAPEVPTEHAEFRRDVSEIRQLLKAECGL